MVTLGNSQVPHMTLHYASVPPSRLCDQERESLGQQKVARMTSFPFQKDSTQTRQNLSLSEPAAGPLDADGQDAVCANARMPPQHQESRQDDSSRSPPD